MESSQRISGENYGGSNQNSAVDYSPVQEGHEMTDQADAITAVPRDEKGRVKIEFRRGSSGRLVSINDEASPALSNSHKLTFRKLAEMPTYLPNPWVRRGAEVDDDYHDTYENVIAYHLGWLQRVFVVMEYPNSCQLARLYQYVNISFIVTSVLVAYISSLDMYRHSPDTCDSPVCNDSENCTGRVICAPEPREAFQMIDFVCCILFGIDLFVRLLIAPFLSSRILRIVPRWWDEVERQKALCDQLEEPAWGPWEKLFRYWFLPGNVIDTLSTLPYFIIIWSYQAGASTWVAPWKYASSSSAILTVRIARCFRLLKVLDVHPQGSPKLSIIITTVRESFSSLLIMLGFVVVSAIIFGSLIYSVELGDFMVTDAHPDGAYLRHDVVGNELELSPFHNLAVCMYWAIVTMTTLGYGDLYPTSPLGRFIGAACSVYGVLVISLPVTIINNAFSTEMEKFHAGVAAEKRRLRLKNKLKMAVKFAKTSRKIGNHDLSFADPIKISQIHTEDTVNGALMDHLSCSLNQPEELQKRSATANQNGHATTVQQTQGSKGLRGFIRRSVMKHNWDEKGDDENDITTTVEATKTNLESSSPTEVTIELPSKDSGTAAGQQSSPEAEVDEKETSSNGAKSGDLSDADSLDSHGDSDDSGDRIIASEFRISQYGSGDMEVISQKLIAAKKAIKALEDALYKNH